MTATKPYKLRLAHAVIQIGRQLPHEPLGSLIHSILTWRRLPLLVPSADGQRWARYALDTQSGKKQAIRPNQFACLVKRTAHTPAETAILHAALHLAGGGGRANG